MSTVSKKTTNPVVNPEDTTMVEPNTEMQELQDKLTYLYK
ncbi:hypothetical protein MY1884_008011 [Beauveria asiatica]